MDNSKDKAKRILHIYTKLLNGGVIYKAEEAKNFDVNERTIQRDLDDIRNFMDSQVESTGIVNNVVYDRMKKGYCLEQIYQLKFTNPEILAICKILLDSRAFTKREMSDMLGKLISCCVPKENQKLVTDLIRNEEYHYIEPRHKKVFIDKMWDIGQAIQGCRYVEIQYTRLKDKATKVRKVKPVAIMFSDFYFYMAAYLDDEKVREDFDVKDDSYPTIYRIDRIEKLTMLSEHFHIPYASRFEEGEFRKRIQFMFGGKLRKVKFKYSGLSVEAILDRLPTAKILEEKDGVYTISAEVFGDGIDMWMKGQQYIEIMEEVNNAKGVY